MSMRTSVSKVCFTAFRRIALDRRQLGLKPALSAIRNRRTSAFSRRAFGVVLKPGVAASAGDVRRETNNSAVKVLGNETLRGIARELVETVRRNVTQEPRAADAR
jgi:hypothetical protein